MSGSMSERCRFPMTRKFLIFWPREWCTCCWCRFSALLFHCPWSVHSPPWQLLFSEVCFIWRIFFRFQRENNPTSRNLLSYTWNGHLIWEEIRCLLCAYFGPFSNYFLSAGTYPAVKRHLGKKDRPRSIIGYSTPLIQTKSAVKRTQFTEITNTIYPYECPTPIIAMILSEFFLDLKVLMYNLPIRTAASSTAPVILNDLPWKQRFFPRFFRF